MANYVGNIECHPDIAKHFDSKSYYTLEQDGFIWMDLRPYYRRKLSHDLVRVYFETSR